MWVTRQRRRFGVIKIIGMIVCELENICVSENDYKVRQKDIRFIYLFGK